MLAMFPTKGCTFSFLCTDSTVFTLLEYFPVLIVSEKGHVQKEELHSLSLSGAQASLYGAPSTDEPSRDVPLSQVSGNLRVY